MQTSPHAFAAPPPHPDVNMSGMMQSHPPHPPHPPHTLMPPQLSQPMEGIADPHHNDVLCGRGVTTNRHKGNENFRGFVNRNKALYVSSTKRQKMTISRSIVEAVRNLNPPGRFLEKDLNTGLWFDVGDKKAVEKTSQALRDGAANLRKQLSEDLTDPTFIGAVFGNGNDNGKGGKDNKNMLKQNKKKIKNIHSRPFSESLCTPSLTHEPRRDKDKQNEIHASIQSPSQQIPFPPSANPTPSTALSSGQFDMKVDRPPSPNRSPFGMDHGTPFSGSMPPRPTSSHKFSSGHKHSRSHGHVAGYQQRPPYENYRGQPASVVSPCSSQSANSPQYTPSSSPPYSPTPNSPPYAASHNPFAPPNQHSYIPSNSPPFHTQQGHYWNSHLSPHATASSHSFHAVTPEGRSYYPPTQHHHNWRQQSLGHPGETPQDYVEVTHEGQYQFPEGQKGRPLPISPGSHDGASTNSHYYDSYPHNSDGRYHHPGDDEHMSDVRDSRGHRDTNPSPSPAMARKGSREQGMSHFEENDAMSEDEKCRSNGRRSDVRSHLRRASDAMHHSELNHTEFTPPRNKGRKPPSSVENSPISLGSGKLEDIWSDELPLMFDQKSDGTANSSFKSGDSILAPLPFRENPSSNISPFMNILCGCAPAYYPNDNVQRIKKKPMK